MRNTPTGVGKTLFPIVFRSRCRKHPHGRGEDLCCLCCCFFSLETPPRAWGRHTHEFIKFCEFRNTPTGVGKTCLLLHPVSDCWKHPHGRGEDQVGAENISEHIETPPRAWGRPVLLSSACRRCGNTPTGVGKTGYMANSISMQQKHPHGRGEDTSMHLKTKAGTETPPRAWGRLYVFLDRYEDLRNTPTGVGKTYLEGPVDRWTRKHPHGRGEDLGYGCISMSA